VVDGLRAYNMQIQFYIWCSKAVAFTKKRETGASFIYTINTYQAVKVLIQVRVRVPVGDRVYIQVVFRCWVGNGVRT